MIYARNNIRKPFLPSTFHVGDESGKYPHEGSTYRIMTCLTAPYASTSSLRTFRTAYPPTFMMKIYFRNPKRAQLSMMADDHKYPAGTDMLAANHFFPW